MTLDDAAACGATSWADQPFNNCVGRVIGDAACHSIDRELQPIPPERGERNKGAEAFLICLTEMYC
jgi:hypothetical protein